jgi:thiamine biosynthesis lipoprotein
MPTSDQRRAQSHTRTETIMGTFVTIEVVGDSPNPSDRALTAGPIRDDAIARAFGWFHRIEGCCTRFDPESELMQLTTQIGSWVTVSDMLYQPLAFALAVAEETDGAFDPTVGHRMAARGFCREHRTGRIVRSSPEPGGTVSYRDVYVDPARQAVLLDRPLVLDLGAVAKGLAIDMAARELAPFADFAIDAGGDLFLAGNNTEGRPWTIGIRHPRLDRTLIDTVTVSGAAVCTSGDYERRGADGSSHLLDPRTDSAVTALASVTALGPTAMLTDALSTAAFVLGPVAGAQLLECHGLEGLFVTPALERSVTRGMQRRYQPGHGTHAAAC